MNLQHCAQSHPESGQFTRRSEVRWRPSEYAQVEARARMAMVPLSEFVRRAALGKPLTRPLDPRLVGELRRLGALLKRQYPGTTTWTAEERRRYWQTREQLIRLAHKIEKQTQAQGDLP